MKTRKKFLAILLALIISSVCFFVVFNLPAPSVSAENKNWLAGYEYRKSHDVIGSPGAGTDYQIKILAHYQKGIDSGSNVYLDSKCQKNFDDVRFTSGDGLAALSYWVETKTDADQAVFWVKINDNLDSNQTIYIYYGNATINTASNMQSTFPFADDFSGNSLNTTNWRVYGLGKVTVCDGKCTLETVSGDHGWIYIMGKTFVGTNYSVRFSTSIMDQSDYRWTHHGFASIFNESDNSGGRIDMFPNFITASQEEWSYDWSLRSRSFANTSRLDLSGNAPVSGAFYTDEIQRNGISSVLLYSNDVLQGSLITNVPIIKMGAMFSADNGKSSFYAATTIDWVVIHKYVANEPTQGIWGIQETVLPNNIFGVTLGN